MDLRFETEDITRTDPTRHMPSGVLFNQPFDGITLSYHLTMARTPAK